MIINAPQPIFSQFKLFRSSIHDDWQFKGKMGSHWTTIYGRICIDAYYQNLIRVNYGVDIEDIPHITGEG